MSEIQIDLSTDNSFSQNQQTRTVALARQQQTTAPLQGARPVPFTQNASFRQSLQDNVQISKSAQFIRQNTANTSQNTAANSPLQASTQARTNTANTKSISLQNGTLSLVQQETGITGTFQRNNGTDFRLNINQNISLQENDDNSAAVFFEQDNISKKFHADGKIAKFQGNILDDSKKSVRINSQGGTINAENDTIFALADKTTINAKGNNTIVLKKNMRDVQINAKNGDNTIIGEAIQNAAILLINGKNTLNFKSTDYTSIRAKNSNVRLNTGKLTVSTIDLEKGTHTLNLQESLHNSIHFESNSFNQESKLNIFGKTENTLIHAKGEKVSLTLQNSNNNFIESTAKFTHAKFSHSNDDAITIKGYNNTVSTGTLTDTAMELKGSQAVNLQSNVITGNSNLAVSGQTAKFFANTISSGSAVALDAQQFAHTQIQTVADNAAVDINARYYTNAAIGTIKNDAYAGFMGDGTITVNALQDNANLRLGTGIANVAIGSISDNAVVQGGENALQTNIGTNQNIADISTTLSPASAVNSQEQTRALNSYISTANNFQKNQNQMPINRLV